MGLWRLESKIKKSASDYRKQKKKKMQKCKMANTAVKKKVYYIENHTTFTHSRMRALRKMVNVNKIGNQKNYNNTKHNIYSLTYSVFAIIFFILLFISIFLFEISNPNKKQLGQKWKKMKQIRKVCDCECECELLTVNRINCGYGKWRRAEKRREIKREYVSNIVAPQ